jgi:GNAT superfamily N-acetyltransferase
MYVQPECRKKSISKLLLNELIERAKDARKNKILIWLNEIVPLTVEGIFV